MLNFKDKKVNIIVTAAILAVAIALIVLMGNRFSSFRKYEADFYPTDYDEVHKFHEYSKTLEGEVADSDIYVFYGNQNTVAVVKKGNKVSYDTLDKINAETSICGTASAIEIAKNGINEKATGTITANVSAVSASEAIANVKSGSSKIAIVSYGDAREAIKAGDVEVVDVEIEKVPKVLVMGGTHPNEPSGQLAATIFLENAGQQVKRGTLYVINEVNKSAYSHSQPQEATSWYYTIPCADGSTRTFKFGSRATNTVDQWPTPDVYTHSSGQQLSSSEVRNINRAYPGNEYGTHTERIAYAVTECIRQNDITMVIDLHEASPEYITINAIISHNDASGIAAEAVMWNLEGIIDIGQEISPVSMRGLTHRELGDYTNTYAFLCETSNASQGKIRGAFTDGLITYSKTDPFYEYLAELDKKNKDGRILYARPVSIDERVARHTCSILSLISGFNSEAGANGYTRDTLISEFIAEDFPIEKREAIYVGTFEFESTFRPYVISEGYVAEAYPGNVIEQVYMSITDNADGVGSGVGKLIHSGK